MLNNRSLGTLVGGADSNCNTDWVSGPWTGCWAHYRPHWFVSVHMRRIPAAAPVSSRCGAIGFIKQGLLTVDACPGVWSADVDIATLMTPRLLHQGVFTTIYELRRGFMMLANINCCVSSRARGAAWPRGHLSTIRIPVPNRDSIRSNTNSAFGPLFGPVRIRVEYSVQAYFTHHAC